MWHLPAAAAEALTTRQFADLVSREIGRAIKLRASSARRCVSWLTRYRCSRSWPLSPTREQPSIVDSTPYQRAFPDAISITPHAQAIADTVHWRRRPQKGSSHDDN